MKQKNTILFITIFMFVMMIVGGTYAYWTWSSDVNKNVVFNTAKGLEDYIIYDEGTSHFVGNFQPSSDYCGGISNTIAFLKTAEASDVDLVATVNMDVNSIEDNIRNSDYVKWVITAGDSCSSTVINSGTFKNVVDGSTITLETNIGIGVFTDESGNSISKSNADTMLDSNDGLYNTNLEYFRENANSKGNMFTIWIWIDEAGSNLSSLSSETIDVNIWTQIDMVVEN